MISEQTPGGRRLHSFSSNKFAVAGVVILAILFLFAFVGPLIDPYGEYELFYLSPNGQEYRSGGDYAIAPDWPEMTLESKAPPSRAHPLGTDADAFDVLTRLCYGGRISLSIGLCALAIQLLIGTLLGGVAGYYGGAADAVIMRVVEMFNSVPLLPVYMILSSVMLQLQIRGVYKIAGLVLIMGIFGWCGIARMVRGQIISLRERDYMLAAEAAGLRARRKLTRHLLPNVAPQLIQIATLHIGGVIMTESSLSFLGIGLPFPYASWGKLVASVSDLHVLQNNANIWLPPGLALMLCIMAFNFIGEGINTGGE